MSVLSLNITTTNVSYEYYGFTYINLSLGYSLFYNGSINIVPVGGTPPYSFILTSPYSLYQPDGYFIDLSAETYSFQISDVNGQTIDTTITITSIYPQPSLTLSNIVYPGSCASSDGSFTLIGSGGTPPYTYSIDGGASFTSNNTFTNLSPGYYPVLIIKDANGFLATTGFNTSYSFNCKCCPFIILADLSGAASCSNNTGTVLAGSDGGKFPIQFSGDGINYSPGTVKYDTLSLNNIDTQYVHTFTNLSPGIHFLYAKDDTGAVAITAIPVLNVCSIAITYVSVAAACQQNDGSITVTATNGTAPYTYTMNGTNFQTSNIFAGLGVGDYNIWVKDANAVVSSTTAIVYDKCPTVTATERDETCGQDNGIISATGYKGTTPYQFSIDGINFASNNIFSGLAAGNYTVTIQDAKGFKDSTAVTVNNNCVQVTGSVSNTTCSNKNGSIAATATNGTPPYQYSIDGVNFQISNLFSNLASGNYIITAKDANGLTAIATVTITNAPGPQISIATSQASCNNTNGTITITATGGTIPLQYSIDNGDTYQVGNVFSGLDSAQYIAVVKDANGCIANNTVQLTALPTPKFSIGSDTTLCTGQTLVLNGPVAPGYQYLWQDASTAGSYPISQTGTYTLQVTNSYGCSSTSAMKAIFSPVPVFSIGNDTVLCSGKTITLAPSPLKQGSYQWSTGSTAGSLNINFPGVYWLLVSENGCASQETITVSYKPSPILSLGNDTTLCAGQTLLLDATNNNSTYAWQDGSTGPEFKLNSAGTYSVKVDENGCDTTGSLAVSYISKPFVQLGSDTTLCMTEQLILNASYPQATYEWQDGSTSPTYTVLKAGLYSVDIANACGDTKDSINVAYEDCACKFYIPNAFTPNGDGNNDVFMPKYQCLFSNYELKVFNRWGQLLFDSRNSSVGWDGNSAAHPQSTGVYVWQLSYKDDLTGKMIQKNGTVILIR